MRILLLLLLLVSFSFLRAENEFHFGNEFAINYNDINGSGKSQSSLSEGWNYLDTINLNGSGEKKAIEYNYNLGFKLTNDKKNDPKKISLTNINANFKKEYNNLAIGDIFDSFSQYTLVTSLKGISYKYINKNKKLPEFTSLFGYAYPRWESLWKDPLFKSIKRQAYGLRASQEILGDFKLGLNYINIKDLEAVYSTDNLYNSYNASIDFSYNPLPSLTMNGEIALSDYKDKTNNISKNDKAYRVEIIADHDPSKVDLEYEEVKPDFLSPLGSSVPDRRKMKIKWRNKYTKYTTFNTSLLYYRNNLNGALTSTTFDYRPEISMSVKKIIPHRVYSFANFSYKFDRKYGSGISQSDHYFNVNYKDKVLNLDNDSNLGYTIYNTKTNVRKASEFNFNTSFSQRYENNEYVFRPQINLGTWYSKDELSYLTNKIYEYSLAFGFEKPSSNLSSDLRFGQNILDVENGDNSKKLFSSLNTYLKIKTMKMDSTIFLRLAYNDYNFSTTSNCFREKSVTLGLNTYF